VSGRRLIKRTTTLGEGGEVLEQQDFLISREGSPMFIKLYPEGYKRFLSIRDSDWKIFCACIMFMEKDTGCFRLDRERKEEISMHCKKEVNTISMSISRLVKEKLIIRDSRGKYSVNNEIVFNGRESKKYKH